MQTIFTSARHVTVAFCILVLLTAVLLISCKKNDTLLSERSTAQQNGMSFKTFFDNADLSNTSIKRAVTEIKRRNEATEFISAFAAKDGFPVWDKAHTVTINRVPKKNIKAQTNSLENITNTDTLLYVPVVLQNANTVNGYILIIIHDSIGLNLFRAKDYKAYYDSGAANETTSSTYALQMMMLDKEVFQRTDYELSDTVLFPEVLNNKIVFDKNNNAPSPTTSGAVIQKNNIWLNPDGDAGNNSGDEVYTYNTYYTEEPDAGTNNFRPSPPPPRTVFIGWLPIFNGTPVAIHTGPYGGGGGSGSGNPIPPVYPCNPNIPPAIGEGPPLPPCPEPGPGTGWIPDPTPPPPTTINPCDSVNKYAQGADFYGMFERLKDSVPTRRETLFIFNNVLEPSSATNPIHLTNGIENQFMVYPTPANEWKFIGSRGWIHNHFADADSALLIFSAGDLSTLVDQVVKDAAYFNVNWQKFMIGVISDSGARYMLMVQDITQFTTWAQSWGKSEYIIETKYNGEHLNQKYLPLSVADTEKRFLKIIHDAGLRLLRGSSDFRTWTGIKLNSTGTEVINTINCL